MALAVAAAVALAGLVAGTVVLLDRGDDGASNSAQDGDKGGDEGGRGERTKGPGGAEDQVRERDDAPTDQPPTGPTTVPTAAPDGYELITDPAGFRVAVPKGYTRSYEAPRVYYYSPGKAFRIGIHPQTLDPRGAVRVMREAHAEGSQRYEGYRDGRVTETTHNGRPAALWEFTWNGAQDDGGARRTYDLSWDEGGRMYDVWVSAPVAEKDEGRRHFATVVDTFDLPGGGNQP
ncbi:hypothetical protein OYE22_20295 [Streptomyces sp. 71268]|uniref:hypothetical protein n=1 Tax=Streptomyces sp. 71268 TaxID=3002640 RepID=UPI0023F6C4E1|nr:hypothetical protein [Streptomyces sp. 71268]WEV27281.1 hypothetical protein OYE22_20295 [Streptomyces sp. 71268]